MSLASLKVPTLFLCYREIFTYLFLVPRLVWVLGYHTRINLFVGCVREMSIRNTGFSTVEHILNAGVIFQQLLWGGKLVLHFLAPECWDYRHGPAHPVFAVLRG